MKRPVVALVGKPNVGKSTIFNRILKSRVAIIEDTPGVTRDRIYGLASYHNYKFHLIDTGGITLAEDDFNKEIKAQVELALDEADVVLFIVDGKQGLTSDDLVVKDLLMRSKKRVIVVINKVDNNKQNDNLYDFYELGFDTYIPVSGEHNLGFLELLDEVVKDFKVQIQEEYDDETIKISVVGKPNVGKSSLINALLNEERAIVSDISGTTRDAVDTPFTFEGRKLVAIDTAGIKKKGKVYESIDKYSVMRSLKAMDRSDICLLVIDGSEEISAQDKHVGGYVTEAGRGVIIVVNKWDLVTDKSMKEMEQEIRAHFKFLSYAPIVFLSAKTKKRIHTLMPEIFKVFENINREVKTSLLNNCILRAFQQTPPPAYKGKRLKIYFSHQSGVKPPYFTINVNNKGLVHFTYERYLENQIRDNFDFAGTPIFIKFKNKNE